MADLKSCKLCGGIPTRRIMTSMCGSIYIASVRCDKCQIEKKIAYSPGRVNKPKNEEATALRLVGKEWNRWAREKEHHER